MALRNITNETPKEFIKNTTKIYLKEILKGVVAALVVITFMFVRYFFTGGSAAGYVETGISVTQDISRTITEPGTE